VGFANLNKEKNLVLYFVKDNVVVKSSEVGLYNGEDEINIGTDVNLSNGEYEIYLGINSTYGNNYCYEIRFSNNNIWNENIKANKIGVLIKK
jgi:hypothetical protein